MKRPRNAEQDRRRRLILLCLFAAAAFGATHLLPRIPQDPCYHAFADARTIAAIPNFNDVVSNAPFLIVGLAGLLVAARRGRGRFIDDRERTPWRVVFVGVIATGVGSAYYHLAPTHGTLAWDRLPMTVVFAALVATQISERIGVRAGLRSLAPLIAFGAASVAYWAWTESAGRGDLRWYGFVQFFPPLLIVALWAFWPARYDRLRDYGYAALWYGVAKATEALDRPIYAALGAFSGHTLKHVAAALALAACVRHLALRRPIAAVSATDSAFVASVGTGLRGP